MRHLATINAVSIIASSVASLLVLACGSSPDAGKPADGKPAPAATTKATSAKAPTSAPPTPAPPSEPPTPAPPKEDEYGQEFCATIIPCFQKLEFSGSFSADVTVDVEPDGRVSSVSFTGQAPQPVQTCITDAIKPITLADYNGKPGRVRCTKSGQLMGGTQMIMSDGTYEVREPGGTQAEADAGKAEADTKAGKAG